MSGDFGYFIVIESLAIVEVEDDFFSSFSFVELVSSFVMLLLFWWNYFEEIFLDHYTDLVRPPLSPLSISPESNKLILVLF